MENSTKRINPLLIAAAASVIALSAVGVAAVSSKGQAREVQIPQEIVQPLAPAISHPVTKAPATKPALRGNMAVVESVREVKEPGDAKGLVTVIGAAGGAIAGHQIEKQVRADKRWETTLRFDDGTKRTLTSEQQPAWRAGDRVRA